MAGLVSVEELIARVEDAADDVSASSDRSSELIEQMSSSIQQLDNSLESSRQQTNTIFSSAEEVIVGIEDEIDNQLQVIQERFRLTLQQVTEIDTQIEAISSAMNTQLSNIQTEADSLIESHLKVEAQDIEEKLLVLKQDAETSEAELDRLFNGAVDAIGSFQTLSESVQNSFDEQKQFLFEQFSRLKDDTELKVDSVMTVFDQLMTQSDSSLDELKDSLDSTSDSSLSTVETVFTQTAIDRFTDDSGQLSEELAELQSTSDESNQLLGSTIGDVFDVVQDVLDVIKPVTEVLDKVKSIL